MPHTCLLCSREVPEADLWCPDHDEQVAQDSVPITIIGRRLA